eukprot:jgi/Mesvir1/8921/Mv14206-RA.1
MPSADSQFHKGSSGTWGCQAHQGDPQWCAIRSLHDAGCRDHPTCAPLSAAFGSPRREAATRKVIAAAASNTTAPVQDAPSQVTGFGVRVEQLRELSSADAEDVPSKLAALGGTRGLLDALKTHPKDGLSTAEASSSARRGAFGENRMPTVPPKTIIELALEALEDPTLVILMISGAISLVLGLTVEEDKSTGWIDGAAILAAVLVVVTVTAVNNFQKEKQFRKLNAVKDDVAVRVWRDGHQTTISTFDLVAGDIVLLEVGDILPADGIIIEADGLKVDESHLTGESDAVKKDATDHPLALSGSKVFEGAGKMAVIGVGQNSMAGIISSLILFGENKQPGSGGEAAAAAAGGDIAEEAAAARAAAAKEGEGEGEGGPGSLFKNKSVLQAKLDDVAVQIGSFGLVAAIICSGLMMVQFTYGHFWVDKLPWQWAYMQDYVRMFITGVTVLVVAVPEGLPLAVTISFAYAVMRMLEDNNLVRHLDACETMGSATAICSDKTGTLTENRMRVTRAYLLGRHFRHDAGAAAGGPAEGFEYQPLVALGDDARALLLDLVSLNSTATLQEGSQGAGPVVVGNKTEGAMLLLLEALGMPGEYVRVRQQRPVYKTWNFSSDRKRMTVVTSVPEGSSSLTGGIDGKPVSGSSGRARVYTKGAAEIVTDLCSSKLGADGSVAPLSGADRKAIASTISGFADQGLRCIALSYRDMAGVGGREDVPEDAGAVEKDLTLVGIVGIEDPIREEVPHAIKRCQDAGITVRMVTGDNVSTATAIARKCGILPPFGAGQAVKEGSVMQGSEFRAKVLDAEGQIRQDVFDKTLRSMRVLARSSPADKFVLVSGLRNMRDAENNRQVVAVTGDGTNDAPALKKADVGFAMGITGTSVAKDASDIILLDDNFTSIVKAVKWGRNVYDNISKFLQFQLTVNVSAIIISCTGAAVLSESPLRTVQMLWVNLIMDTLASLALATEPPQEQLLDRPPYPSGQDILSPQMIKNIAGQALYQIMVMWVLIFNGETLFGIPCGRGLFGEEPTVHYTIVFNAFVMMQLFNQINSRKVRGERNVLAGLTEHPLFLYIVGGELLAQWLIVEFGGRAFDTTHLTLEQWAACIGFGAGSLVVKQVLDFIELPGSKNKPNKS